MPRGLPFAVDVERKRGDHSRYHRPYVQERIAVRRGRALMVSHKEALSPAKIAALPEWVRKLPHHEVMERSFDLIDDYSVDIRLITNLLHHIREEEAAQ
ncbi:hypothetical protein CcrColossus_gp442 [Caulobacter phage CcrColossus]|uniref:Uncharacterized protein n=1 Tax=Caulobacter phage CcrColossus TaxID=1211640 RepID=K4K6T8_9CAUD|nr:hypothetical protein CcrColossus_gp442 [Caulobacter phage CcrColossus]AFU88312.1 hypothetical protein CcrColossus_gp442 [Caulobacter phage CcrColossus]